MPGDSDILDSGGGRWWQDDDAADVAAAGRTRRPGGAQQAPGPGSGRRPPGPRPRRRVLAALVAAALLLGIAVGALGQRALRERADRATDRAAVDVRLTDEQPVTTQGPAEWALQLVLHNAGPVGVRILDARVDGPGVVSDPLREQVPLDSDDDGQLLVRGTIDCGVIDEAATSTSADAGLALSVSVRTADGTRHDVDLGRARTGAGRQRIADSCGQVARGTLATVGPMAERSGTLDARLQLQLVGAAGVRVDGVRLVPPGAFRTTTIGLPMRLTGATPGQFAVSVRVEGCPRSLTYSPATGRVELRLSGAAEHVLGLALPRDFGEALVRLSERSCGP